MPKLQKGHDLNRFRGSPRNEERKDPIKTRLSIGVIEKRSYDKKAFEQPFAIYVPSLPEVRKNAKNPTARKRPKKRDAQSVDNSYYHHGTMSVDHGGCRHHGSCHNWAAHPGAVSYGTVSCGAAFQSAACYGDFLPRPKPRAKATKAFKATKATKAAKGVKRKASSKAQNNPSPKKKKTKSLFQLVNPNQPDLFDNFAPEEIEIKDDIEDDIEDGFKDDLDDGRDEEAQGLKRDFWSTEDEMLEMVRDNIWPKRKSETEYSQSLGGEDPALRSGPSFPAPRPGPSFPACGVKTRSTGRDDLDPAFVCTENEILPCGVFHCRVTICFYCRICHNSFANERSLKRHMINDCNFLRIQ